MEQTFFFYDLETSGVDPKEQRIMQFAGQRTDLQLNEIGQPFNFLISLTDDVLPEPYAIMVTSILPQQTIAEGITEAEFLQTFTQEIATAGTIFVGYNSIRFDDEFMRYLHYRNFYDPYEWHWKDGRSRWDLLDVTRMTRALRPDGIKWPFDPEGKPTNRLELLTSLNNLEHSNAHNALSDVRATISFARLLKSKQPKLFSYLLKMRDKSKVEAEVKSKNPFVYSSGKYSSEQEKTTVAVYLADNPKSGALVYDLRFDPNEWLNKTPEQLVESWRWKKDSQEQRLPIKTLQYNRCPAIAPTSVLDEESQQRLSLDMQVIAHNHQTLISNPAFSQNVLKALDAMNKQQQTAWDTEPKLVDGQLYEGFIKDTDKPKMERLRKADINNVGVFKNDFEDARLQTLLPLYKARNYPKQLSNQDKKIWEDYKYRKLLSGGEQSRANKYFNQLQGLATNTKINTQQKNILEDLKIYGESILPDLN